MKKWAVGIVLVVIGICAIGIGAYVIRNDSAVGPIDYTFGTVATGDIESVVVATGAIEPLNTYVVGSELSGQVSDIFVDFNDQVEAGQLLAIIDPRSLEARVTQQEADVEVATANISSREAELSRAQANLRQAEREIARVESLKRDGHVSEADLERSLTDLENAESTVAIAKSTLSNAHAALTQREAQLSQGKLDLERTKIRSPTSGTVINRNIEIGQTVAASFSAPELFVIADDLSNMTVEATIDEADIGRVNEGLFCRFTVDAHPDKEFTGRVQQIRKQPLEAQNVVTYKVIVSARNDEFALLPGMTANVEIILGKREGVLTIPNGATRYISKDAAPPQTQASSGAAPQTGGGGGRGGFGGGGGGRGGGGTDAMIQRLQSELALSDEQVTQVRAEYDSMRQQMMGLWSSAGQGGEVDRTAMQRQMQQMMATVNKRIESILTAEQIGKFQEMMGGTSTKRATVYVLNAEGKETAKPIRIGLSDDTSTEVVEGLEEGEQVIVRARRSAA